jgi:hypothetical protein
MPCLSHTVSRDSPSLFYRDYEHSFSRLLHDVDEHPRSASAAPTMNGGDELQRSVSAIDLVRASPWLARLSPHSVLVYQCSRVYSLCPTSIWCLPRVLRLPPTTVYTPPHLSVSSA